MDIPTSFTSLAARLRTIPDWSTADKIFGRSHFHSCVRWRSWQLLLCSSRPAARRQSGAKVFLLGRATFVLVCCQLGTIHKSPRKLERRAHQGAVGCA